MNLKKNFHRHFQVFFLLELLLINHSRYLTYELSINFELLITYFKTITNENEIIGFQNRFSYSSSNIKNLRSMAKNYFHQMQSTSNLGHSSFTLLKYFSFWRAKFCMRLSVLTRQRLCKYCWSLMLEKTDSNWTYHIRVKKWAIMKLPPQTCLELNPSLFQKCMHMCMMA